MFKWLDIRVSLIVAAAIGCILTCARVYGQASDQVWGQRIGERQVNDAQKIVVDERGQPALRSGSVPFLSDIMYIWRLLDKGKDDGPVLFVCSGVKLTSSSGGSPEPIDVLYTALIDGDLATVFNQNNGCWALIVRRNGDGTFGTRPKFQVPYGTEIGGPMTSAGMMKRADGIVQLTVTDGNGKTSQFELRLSDDNPAVYNWAPLGSAGAASRPASSPPPTSRPAASTGS
jgi:hypothetical protein